MYLRRHLPLAFLLVTLFLASCGGSSSGAGGTVNLTYWTHVNAPVNALEKQLITQYEQLHPNVKITYLPVDLSTLTAKLTTSFASGTGPDLFNYFESYSTGLEAKGLLAPVDYASFGVTDSNGFLQRYDPAIVNGYSYKGQVYGIPHEVSAYLFWLNTAAFQATGLNPTTDFPKTWEDVARIGPALTKVVGGQTKQVAIDFDLSNPLVALLTLDAFAHQAGGSLFSADGKQSLVNSQASVKALQTLADFARKDKIYDPSLTPPAALSDLFGNGTAAMSTFGASFQISVLQQNYPNVFKNYTVGPYPTFTGLNPNIGADLYGFGLYVPKSSQHQTEAWKFASYLISQGDSYFKNGGLWLGDNASINSPSTQDFPHWADFKAAFAKGSFLPPLTNFPQILDSMQRAIQRSVLNGQSAQSSLDQAQAEVQPLMS